MQNGEGEDMSIEMLKTDVRKVCPYYAPFLLLTVGYVLFQNTPLSSDDWRVNLITCLQGVVIAWCLFNDSGGTGAFIFSRPLSRKRLFLTRWLTGLSFQLLTFMAVFATIATELRSGIQLLMQSPYQPMVKWYELSILGPITLFSILGYEVVMFLKLRWRIVNARPSMWRDILGTALAIVLCGPILIGIFTSSEPIPYRLTYVALVTIAGTLASLHCYQHLEIEV
jgi:hypothetical protein